MSKKQVDEAMIGTVCNYMLQQNRPYSAVDVWNNLRQEYSKAQIIKCLDIGVEREILREKTISKQKIYFPDQSKLKKYSEEELRLMDEMIIQKQNRVNELSNEIKIAKSELKKYENVMSIEEMTALQTTLKTQIKEMKERISNMPTSAKDENGNEQRKVELLAKLEFYKKHCKERKQIVDRIVDEISENINVTKKQLMEDMGFELE